MCFHLSDLQIAYTGVLWSPPHMKSEWIIKNAYAVHLHYSCSLIEVHVGKKAWYGFFHLSSLLKIFIMTDKPQIRTSSVVTNADKFFSQFSTQNMHGSTKEFFCSPWKKWNVSSGALLWVRVPQSAQQRAISIKDVSGCINELCKGSSCWLKKKRKKK